MALNPIAAFDLERHLSAQLRYSLNVSLEFFIMIFFVTNQLNISKFLPPQISKTIETKLHEFSKFLLIVYLDTI